MKLSNVTFLNFDVLPKIQPEDNLPTRTWLIEPVELTAVSFKKTRMYYVLNTFLFHCDVYHRSLKKRTSRWKWEWEKY